MVPKFILNWIVTAIALAIAAKVVSGIHVDGSWTTYLWIAIVFGFINATIGAVFKLFTFAFIVLTLGVFLLVVNGLMLALTASLIGSFRIDNFASAFLGAVIITVVSTIADMTIVKPLTQTSHNSSHNRNTAQK